MSNITVALDAGHGGSDFGARYNNRLEKDDALNLTKAVGNILENNGVNVFYVRMDDEYETPFKKATDANNAGADYYVSIHRNSSEYPNQYSGIESLVFRDSGTAYNLAANINNELEKAGFNNIGISERPNLVVLRRTRMPAVLVEAGFINTDADNAIFDNKFNEIAQAIADGILNTIYASDATKTDVEGPGNYIPPDNFNRDDGYNRDDRYNQDNRYNRDDNYNMDDNYNTNNNYNMDGNYNRNDNYMPRDNDMSDDKLYRVQVGAYRNKENADRLLNSLLIEGFPAFMIQEDGYYKVQVGAFRVLTNAIKMELRLRHFRYNTYIVYD